MNLVAMVGKNPSRVGAILALGTLPLHVIVSQSVSIQVAAIVLTLVAGIYVGFAVHDGRSVILAAESLVALAFASAALAGLIMTHWAIPVAYMLHGFWDLAHHRRITTSMPGWYVPFCAVFDWVFAAGLTAIWILR